MILNQTPGTRFPIAATIRDPMHDRIQLAKPELAILSHPRFQRLERVQQLGFVSRIWPGARHTRFEHSLGVFHLARLAVEHLRATPEADFLEDRDARTLAAAALLHDIGHYPFSHAIEELGPPVLSHEVTGRNIILDSTISDILSQDWQVDPVRVADIIAPRGATLPPADSLLRGLLSGPLDVDKLDYLPRDAQACGVPYGGVDTARLLDALRIGKNVGDSNQRIVVDAKGVSPLHSLINARQEMFDNVYWHHTNRALMAMLLRAVQEALLAQHLHPAELTELDDWTMLERLSQADMPVSTKNFVRRIRSRHVHKRVLEVSSRAPDLYQKLGRLFANPDARRRIEDAISSRIARGGHHDLEVPAVLIDIPKPEKWSTDVWVKFTSPPLGFTSLMPWADVVGLSDEDFKRFEERRRLIRIVASEELTSIPRQTWLRALEDELGSDL